MIDTETKFFLEPADNERYASYLMLSITANKMLIAFEDGLFTEPNEALHRLFTELFHNMVKFRDPIPGLHLTRIEFEPVDYVEDFSATSQPGWGWVRMEDGKLGVAARYSENEEPQAVAHFVAFQPVDAVWKGDEE